MNSYEHCASLAMVFPGQGSQSVGMLAALAGEFAAVQQAFSEASAVLGYVVTMRSFTLCP
jgi:malonyl CoA-acyl carrier protein transacylase